MGDPMQYIQALYHNTTMPDQQKRQRQIACNTFYDKYGVQQILETAGETAFLTADRNAFRAAKAIGNNVLIGVGNTKCDKEKAHDKIYWRTAPLLMDKTKKEALEKFFGFCELFPGNTATLKADASGLLYLPEAVNGNTNTTIFLCFTDKAGRVQDNRTFVIDTFNKLDLSDTRKFTADMQDEADKFQKIISTIFDYSLIELDSQQYEIMLDKMSDDHIKLDRYYTAFQKARESNKEAMANLTNNYNKARMKAYKSIVESVVSQFNNDFGTSLTHLNKIKTEVEYWREIVAVKLNNRKDAIERFIKNIMKFDQSEAIVMSTLESCKISLAIV
jgi:hypothetical protein